MSEVLIPRVLWAQRQDVIYITFEVFDIKEDKVDIKDDVVNFSGVRGTDGVKFAVSLELFGSIDVSKSKISVGDRQVSLVLAKTESGPFWPRLLKTTQKMNYIHTDFSKWVDEDDEEDEPAGLPDMSNFSNFGMMDQFAGAGSNFGMDDYVDEEEEEAEEELEESEGNVKISGLTKNNESFE